MENTKSMDILRLHKDWLCASGIHFFITRQEAIDY